MTQTKKVYCNKHGVPWELVDWLFENGTSYTSALLPKEVHRGPVGQCYDVCLLNAVMQKNLRYVEGIALSRKDHEWIQHAWLTDGTYAYDPTWKALDRAGNEVAIPTAYIGVEIPTDAAARYVLATEYAGIIANAWRKPEQAATVLPKDCPIIKM